jgi:hypothetical protein
MTNEEQKGIVMCANTVLKNTPPPQTSDLFYY